MLSMTRLSVALTLCLVLTPRPAYAQEKPTRLTLTEEEIRSQLTTDWYGVYFHGKKAGYSVSKLTHDKEKGVYVSTTILLAKLKGSDFQGELKTVEVSYYDDQPPYTLKRASFDDSRGSSKQNIELTRKEKGYEAVIRVGKDKRFKLLPKLDVTLADELTPTFWLVRGSKAKEKLLTKHFSLGELEEEEVRRTVLAVKHSVVQGVKVEYLEVEAVYPKTALTSFERSDRKGRLLSAKIGDLIEMRMEAEAEAKNIEFSADLFVLGSVKVDKKIGNPSRVSGLVLEVDGEKASVFQNGPWQSSSKNGSGTYTLKLGKEYGIPVKATEQEIKENLEETVAYPTTHPKIQELLKKAIGDAETQEEKVKRLARFVYRFLKPDYASKPVSVLELIEVKRGSCVQCAQLFTTLARAAGIPTRQQGGLIYMGDDQKAFGGHEWCEIVVDGYWVPIDPAWNETRINATHISFGADKAGAFRQLSATGKISFRVVEVKTK
jgi:hypothetical protein